ncbi:MAG: aminotransferase class IV [Fidelibacterota bacterium]
MIILWNNDWVEKDEAQIPLLSPAVQYGFGAFETLRQNADGSVILPDEHVRRLTSSLEAIGLNSPFTLLEIRSMIDRIAQRGNGSLRRIKIIVVPEGVALLSEPIRIASEIYQGVAMKTVIQKRPLPEVKSLSYLECFLSYRDARNAGYFEALIVGPEGEVFEGSRSNIFWVDGKELFTREAEVLPGITRQLVIDLSSAPVRYASINVSELKRKEEVFITSSTLGIVPVTRIDDFSLPGPGLLTLGLREKLRHEYYH